MSKWEFLVCLLLGCIVAFAIVLIVSTHFSEPGTSPPPPPKSSTEILWVPMVQPGGNIIMSPIFY